MDGDWVERMLGVRVFAREGQRAPHKPLVMLCALAHLQRTGSSALRYAEVEPVIDDLLEAYGPTSAKSTAAYPFHRLQNDGLWTVKTSEGPSPGDSPTALRRANAVGRFVPELEQALAADPRLVAIAVRSLLEANFPESLHAEIASQLGLDLESLEVAAARSRAATLRRRDPTFRNRVLVAYEYRCAMCGFDGQMDRAAVALDAAHIRWWAFEGPDDLDNALCLCSLHHKLFDRGAVGVTDDRTVSVSSRFIARGDTAERLVLALVGRRLIDPQRGQPTPADEHVQWHGEQVFKAPARVGVME